MGLIEQLGGYERASRVALNYYGSNGKVRYPNMDIDYYGVGTDCAPADLCLIEFTYDDLNLALLEHRRANNIFEVGDFIVDIVSNQFFKIIGVDGGDLLVEQYFWVNSIYQRHATDAEIAAGHRL